MRRVTSIAVLTTAVLSLLSGVVPFGNVVAQVRQFECEGRKELSASEAATLIAAVQSAYGKVSASTGKFAQESYLAALDTSEVSSGTMWFQKPGKMRWSYTEPRQQEVVVSGDTMWVHQIDKNQVMVDAIKSALLSDLPIAFLMGLGDLTRDFDVKSGCRTPDGVVVSLVPKTAKKSGAEGGTEAGGDLSGFDLLLDEGAALPKGAMVTALGGNVTAIVFEKLRASGVNPPAGTFVLEYPKGVDIVDRRSFGDEAGGQATQ